MVEEIVPKALDNFGVIGILALLVYRLPTIIEKFNLGIQSILNLSKASNAEVLEVYRTQVDKSLEVYKEQADKSIEMFERRFDKFESNMETTNKGLTEALNSIGLILKSVDLISNRLKTVEKKVVDGE